MFKTARVGDKVIHERFGVGTVVDTTAHKFFLIGVEFKEWAVAVLHRKFTIDGKLDPRDKNPTLSYVAGYIPPVFGTEPSRDVLFHDDEVVMVRNSSQDDWVLRHFASWNEDGTINCYEKGCSKLTSKGFVGNWEFHSKYEE